MGITGTLNKVNQAAKRYYNAPSVYRWIFLALVLLLSALYQYPRILPLKPQGMHQWRQADCLSITQNFYADDNGFLSPSMHYLGEDGTGKTISEFPIIYFGVGQLWKLFGPEEWIFRLVNLLIFYLGLFALFRSLEALLKDGFMALMASLMLFTSPMLAFYANNFLANVPAFACVLIAWSFFLRYAAPGKTLHLYLAVLFFLLAGLLKITSAISFTALSFIFLLELSGRFRFGRGKTIFHSPRRLVPAFLLTWMLLFVWYLYSYSYNQSHNAGIFLIGTLPIWKMSHAEIMTTLDHIREHFKWDYMRLELSVLLTGMFAFILIRFRKVDPFLRTLTLVSGLGVLAYCCLFFSPLQDHDYYTLNLLIMVPLVCATFLHHLQRHHPRAYYSVLLRLLILAFLVHNADFARRRMSSRYSGWANENFREYVHPFADIGPHLESLGITRQDRVICLPDKSFNITLYLMDRKGWTDFGDYSSSQGWIREKIGMGAKYLMVYDETSLRQPEVQPYTGHELPPWKHVRIFDLRPYR